MLAPLSGYYISNLDGHENAIDYDKIGDLTVGEAEKLLIKSLMTLRAEWARLSGSKWYLVTVMDSKYSLLMAEGDTMKINMPYCGFKDVKVRVEKSLDNAE